MAVSVDARCTAPGVGANTATALNLTTLTVGSGANRVLMVFIGFSGNLGTVTVTWDSGGSNQVCSQIVAITAPVTIARAELWGLVNPASGNKTLRVTCTIPGDITIYAMSFNGGSQAGGSSTFPHSVSASGTAASPSVTLTSATGSYAVSNFSDSGSSSITSPTQHEEFSIPPNTNTINEEGQSAAGASSLVFGVTLPGTDNWALVAADIAPAVTGRLSLRADLSGLGGSGQKQFNPGLEGM